MRKLTVAFALVSMIFGMTAFQCSSTELTSAKLYIQQKNLPKAKESLLKEVEKNPQSDEGFYLLGYVYGEEGDIDNMLESYDNSLAISKKFEQQINESKKYHWATNFNRGVALFNKASSVSTEDSVAMFFDKAIVTFQNAIKCQPDSADTYKNLTFAYINADRSEEAIEPLEKLIELAPSADSYSMLGEIYSDKGLVFQNKFAASNDAADSLKAVEYYNQAIEILVKGREAFPNDSQILLLLSNAYIGANKLDVAMNAFREGVEAEPENKFYRYNYGVLLLGANEFSEASVQFEKAVEIDPEYVNAIYNLAVTYVKWGTKIREDAEAEENYDDDSYKEKFKLALPHLEKYLEYNPEEGAVWNLLGKVYANLGFMDKSKEAFEKADLYQ